MAFNQIMWSKDKILSLETSQEQLLFLRAVLIATKFMRIPLDIGKIQQELSLSNTADWSMELLRALKNAGFRAKWKEYSTTKEIDDIPKPFIVKNTSGEIGVVVRTEAKKVVFYNAKTAQPETMGEEEFREKWDGVVFLIKTQLKLDNLKHKFGLTWFLPVFWQFRKYFREVLMASCFIQIFALVSPLFTQVIIDKVLVHKGFSTLNVLAMGLAIIAVFQMILGFLRTHIFTTLTNKVDVILGARLYKHIVSLPLRYFENRRVGETVARVKELENIRQFVSGSSLILIIDTIFGIIFIIAMCWYSLKLSAVALALIPFMIMLNMIITPIYRQKLDEKFAAGALNQSFLVESITGMTTVKTLALEQQFMNKWENLLGSYVKKSFNVYNVANIANNIGGFFQQISVLLILWVGAHLVISNELSVGQLVAFQMLAGQVNGPILRLVGVWQQFQQTRVSIERIGDIMNTPIEKQSSGEQVEISAGEICLEKISFKYQFDGLAVLQDINLKISAGTMVGIVGPSGSGKSTLVKIIQRLYEPDNGRVLVEGVDINNYSPSEYRKKIGTVLQDNLLFQGTIAENIAVSKPYASMEEIIQVAKLSGAHDFIIQMPQGYETVICERGDSLSGGQRQKIAISRALMGNPKILIFDEATSALDALSEREVMKQIEKLRQGHTLLIITHRLVNVKNCDLIFVMDKGEVCEQGKHQELLNLRGIYHQMYQQQEGGANDVEEI